MFIDFYKYQGTGNDFILINNHHFLFPKENLALIEKLCNRKFGIGADGLMLLESSDAYDFKMVYYNSDGNESTMCGNGGRCIAAFAHQLGISGKKGKFLAIDGEHDFEITPDTVRLKMIDVVDINAKNENMEFVLFTGSPHVVQFRSAIDKLDIIKEAHSIRYNEEYAQAGINVNYVELKDGKIKMRTYERGVEDETLSCGTGTVAAALSFAVQNNLEKGKVDIETPGGTLAVSFNKYQNEFREIWLEGPAQFVYKGSIEV